MLQCVWCCRREVVLRKLVGTALVRGGGVTYCSCEGGGGGGQNGKNPYFYELIMS